MLRGRDNEGVENCANESLQSFSSKCIFNTWMRIKLKAHELKAAAENYSSASFPGSWPNNCKHTPWSQHIVSFLNCLGKFRMRIWNNNKDFFSLSDDVIYLNWLWFATQKKITKNVCNKKIQYLTWKFVKHCWIVPQELKFAFLWLLFYAEKDV